MNESCLLLLVTVKIKSQLCSFTAVLEPIRDENTMILLALMLITEVPHTLSWEDPYKKQKPVSLPLAVLWIGVIHF